MRLRSRRPRRRGKFVVGEGDAEFTGRFAAADGQDAGPAGAGRSEGDAQGFG
jgi:hypothetical protein